MSDEELLTLPEFADTEADGVPGFVEDEGGHQHEAGAKKDEPDDTLAVTHTERTEPETDERRMIAAE